MEALETMEFHGSYGTPWNNSIEFHVLCEVLRFHGIVSFPWKPMDTIGVNGFHESPLIPRKSMDSMESLNLMDSIEIPHDRIPWNHWNSD